MDNREQSGFYTLKGYQLQQNGPVTEAMEDYLEMICRLLQDRESVRVGDLSRMLHVKPSSVTKMIQHLCLSGYLRAEKYGEICLTEKGSAAGEYLLYRHGVVHRFLCALNGTDNELEQAEKIEHFFNRTTIENLERLTKRIAERML